MSKPFYKKWWFWLIVVVLVVGMASAGASGSGSRSSGSKAATSATQQQAKQESTQTASSSASEQQAEQQSAESSEVVIPEVVGMMLNDAASELKDFKLNYIKSDGSEASVWLKSNWRVDDVDPVVGTSLPKGSDITLVVTNVNDEERAAREAEKAAEEAAARAAIEYTDVDASQLVNDLNANAMVAKETYEGGDYRIYGVVRNIDASGDYISIRPADNPYTLTSIQCYVKYDDTLEAIRQLSADQEVVVCGKITRVGEIMGYSVDINRIE